MTVAQRRFSQITGSAADFTTNDFLLGVQTGADDVLFRRTQIFAEAFTTAGVDSTGPINGTVITATHGIIGISPFSTQATLQLGSPGVTTNPYIDFHAGAANLGYDIRLLGSSNGSANGSGTLNMSGTLSIGPVQFTTQKAIHTLSVGPTGVATGQSEGVYSLGSSVLNYNLWGVTEGADGSGDQTWANIFGLQTGGPNSTGSKISLAVNLYKVGDSNPSVGRDHVCFTANAQAVSNDGGTGLVPGVTAKGTLFSSAFGATLSGAAQNYLEIAGTEVDIGINSPATACYRWGWEIVDQGDTHATLSDAAYVIGSASSGIQGFKTGFLMTFANGSQPIAVDGTVIGNDGPAAIAATIANFASFPNWTFTGNLFNFTNFSVTGAGVLSGSELRAGGDVGGSASKNTLTSTSDLTANSTGVGTILFKGVTNRNSSGFIKFYIGTTAYYVPVFSAITG